MTRLHEFTFKTFSLKVITCVSETCAYVNYRVYFGYSVFLPRCRRSYERDKRYNIL